MFEHRQTQRQHWHEALATGEDLGSFAQLVQQTHRFDSAGRPVVFERGGLHYERYLADVGIQCQRPWLRASRQLSLHPWLDD